MVDLLQLLWWGALFGAGYAWGKGYVGWLVTYLGLGSLINFFNM